MPGFDNDIVYARNVDFTGNSLVKGTPQITSNGQLLIGSAAGVNGPCLLAGSLTSSDGSITVTNGAGTISLTVTGGSSVGKTITGNTGGALTPSLGNWNILGTGSLTSGGSGNTLTFSLTGLTNHAVLVGSGGATITKVGPTATAGQVLQSAGAAADPAFSTATYPLTTAQGDLLLSSAANTITTLAKDTNATRYLSNTGTTNNAAWAQVALTTGVSGVLPIANGGSNASSFTQSNGIVTFDGTRLVNYAGPQIDSTGRQTNTSQPLFVAYLATTQNINNTTATIVFDTTTKNVGTSYSTSTGTFTAPKTGVYFFTFTAGLSFGTATSFHIFFIASGSTYLVTVAKATGDSGIQTVTGTFMISMAANDTALANLTVNGTASINGNNVVGSDILSTFSGFLVA